MIKETIRKAHDSQEKLNAFVTIIYDAKQEVNNEESLLNNKPLAVKDNFSTKDILSTGSSNALKDYIPFWDATVIKKIKESGGVIIGKTTMDELGMGGTGKTAHTGYVRNPWDTTKMTAGSSSGSAAAVTSGIVPFAIGSDTGDSVRKPAAFCGIVGFKPTYGLISRYGLFPFASSLDHVGTFARNVSDVAILTDAIKGIDENDMTSFDSSDINLIDDLDNDVKNKKIFYIKEICDLENYKNPSEDLIQTLSNFKGTIKKCEDLGMIVEGVNFDKDLLEAIFPSYQCISIAEATSNSSNLTGIIFGPRGNGSDINEIMKDYRTKNLSSFIKRRFVIGSYILQADNQDKYFLNALRVRRLIVNKMNELFTNYDALILPCSEGGAKDIESIEPTKKEVSILENNMIIGNFGGFPSITIPNGFINDLPIGINITGKIKDDANILNIAHKLESTMNYKDQIAKGWD